MTTATGYFDFSPTGYAAPAVMFYGTWVFSPPTNAMPTTMAVLGPSGAQIMLNPVADGLPGPCVTLRNLNVTQLAYTGTASGSWVEVSAGSAGVPAVYDLDVSLPAGEPGAVLGFLLQEAQDISGNLVHDIQLRWSASLSKWLPSALTVGSWFNQVDIPSTLSTDGQNRTLATISIPAQGFHWWPAVFASSMITGTANTQVDVVARLNSATGDELGRGPGQVGAVTGTEPWFTYMLPTLGPLLLEPAIDQWIQPGTAATIYLCAEQQVSTSDQYATDSTLFSVGIIPQNVPFD